MTSDRELQHDGLPDGLAALNRFRNTWSTDHDTRRKPRLVEFEGVPMLRRRRRNRPPMLGTVAREIS